MVARNKKMTGLKKTRGGKLLESSSVKHGVINNKVRIGLRCARTNYSLLIQAKESRRADAVEAPRAVGRLRVGELELAGRDFGQAVERRPGAERQGWIRGGQHTEEGPRGVAESKLECALDPDRKSTRLNSS